MHRLPAALLRHTQSDGRHHDLLIADPARPLSHPHPLWAARVDHPPAAWARLGCFPLTPLPHHRRRYLDYQGPLTGGRGRVVRLHRGIAAPLLWRDGRIVLDLTLGDFSRRLELLRISDTTWRARVL